MAECSATRSAPRQAGTQHCAVGHIERRGESAEAPRLGAHITTAVKSASLEADSLEPLRRWLGAPWLALTMGAPSCADPPGAPREGTGGELGHC